MLQNLYITNKKECLPSSYRKPHCHDFSKISTSINKGGHNMKGVSKEKLYQELRLESLKNRRWFRGLCHFYKIVSTKLPPYLYKIWDLDEIYICLLCKGRMVTLVVSHLYDAGLNSSKTLSYYLLSMTGVNWIFTLGMLTLLLISPWT